LWVLTCRIMPSFVVMVHSVYIRNDDHPFRFWDSVLILGVIGIMHSSTLFADSSIDFNRDIRPILSEHCFPCHGPDRNNRKADLRLDLPDGLSEPRENGPILYPGKAGNSQLILRILSHDQDEIMPPPDALLDLDQRQKDLLNQWVNEGAQWEKHWAFVPPRDWELPDVKMTAWARRPLDLFVLDKLESMGQNPSQQADARSLLRRLSFDLTGMPPQAGEVDGFEEEFSDEAYDAWVERLLASPQFGERMALPWMDAARYADTHGYQNDGDRDMWRWRDWVIDAFNSNMPFDQFTIEQLAGDLLPNPTLDQKIATGFNRNHRYNSEGGSIPQEVLTENVADRVETTSTTWLGLTMGCARCHDHKYDPLTTEDYYGMYAFFHNVPETGRAIRDGNSEPFIKAPTWQQQEVLQELEQALEQSENALQALQPTVDQALKRWHEGREWKQQNLSFIQDGLIHARSFNNGLMGWDATVLKEQAADTNVALGDGIQGSGLRLNGHWDGSLGDIGRFTNMTPYAISLWVRPDSDRNGALFSRIQDGVDGKGYQLVYEQGRFRYLSISQGFAGRIGARTVQTFTPGQWYHVTVTYDATMSARGVGIFVNGEEAELELLRNNDSNPGGISSESFRLGKSTMADDFNGVVDELRIYSRVLTPSEIKVLSEPLTVQSILDLRKDTWSPRQFHVIQTIFLENTEHADIRHTQTQLGDAKKRLSRYIKTLPTVMVMAEMKEARQTHILVRGQYDQPGRSVEAGVPAFLADWKKDYPSNRLGLAQWLVNGNHPLTARVFVNRIWQMFFDQGLVKTSEDFGVQGVLPTHPKLLDWLAVDFMASGWDIKRLIKSIVTSSTYRQESSVSSEALEWDTDNKWLARGPQKRLPAHFVRDQLLELSGLKVDRMGGAPVFPYQPDDLWGEVSRKTYPESKGASLYRRSVYTYFKRTVAPPLMQTFDAADRESCIVRQQTTNTPLQALAMLNAPILLEAALELAKSARSTIDLTPEAQVKYLFKKVLLRSPNDQELATLSQSYFKYQAMSRDERESTIIELDKPNVKITPDFFPGFCISLTLLGLDETLSPK
jgi:hypothetical protein